MWRPSLKAIKKEKKKMNFFFQLLLRISHTCAYRYCNVCTFFCRCCCCFASVRVRVSTWRGHATRFCFSFFFSSAHEPILSGQRGKQTNKKTRAMSAARRFFSAWRWAVLKPWARVVCCWPTLSRFSPTTLLRDKKRIRNCARQALLQRVDWKDFFRVTTRVGCSGASSN